MTTTRVPKRRMTPESIGLRPTIENGVTIADLLKRLGNVPASRVRLFPTPGTATESDVIKVVEVLSKSNTKPELDRKLREYFEAGVRSVWLVNPKNRTVRHYTALNQSVLVNEDQSLDGGTILPGFVLRLRDLFGKDEP